jgi:PAS domain S-box-containing protein
MAKKNGKTHAPAGEPAPAAPALVVGIGASAGGLGPISALLPQLKPGCGLAVILAPHLGPGGDAVLISLCQSKALLRVDQAAEGMPLLADHIYVMPSRSVLSLINGKFSVQDASQCEGLRMPIDHFFCTLAADQGRRGVGIILSGSGKDGTQGLAEIKAVGGATAVQDPQTAEFPDMPSSAIAAGHADAVLPPQNLGAFLADCLAETSRLTAQQAEGAGLDAVLAAVRNAIGHDFHCYKRPTLARRTRRRMTLHQLDSYDDYARMIRTNKEEAAALRKDLLIGVTEFFRQAEAWGVLEEKVVSDLVQRAPAGSTLRVWVPACSIGKEAYSVAMLMVENIERSGKKLALQVFATDADASAVDIARSGLYAEEDLKGLSRKRLERFCVRKNGRYEFVKELRGVIVFAPQDLLSDPPFSKLDLVSCRNLLIYLDQAVQKKIIQLLHFALRDGGYIFLGSAETICGQDNLFDPVSQKWRIYRKLGVASPVGLDLPLRPASKPAVTVPPAASRTRLTLPSIAQQALAERYAPAAAVADRKGALLYTHGNVGDFLEVPVGEATGLLADAAREGLRNRLSGAMVQAVTENKKIVVQARVRKGKKSIPVKVTVSPMRHPREADGLLLVTFETLRLPKSAPVAASGESPHSDMRQLEDELKITREELSSTIEQFAQSNENLKASNEEVTASNEELQSANEELETSKEELQSLNEELNAVNQRLQEKVVELEQASNDVSNLLTSGDVATIFLDKRLSVRRFTPAVTKLLSLIETDIGRPLADITRKFKDDALLDDAQRVLVDLTPATAEVRAHDGEWYNRRILPYRTKDDRIEGVVITFNDVTDLKELADALRCSEQTVRQSETRYRELVQNANSAIIRWNRDGTITFFNEYAQTFFGYSAQEAVGKNVGFLVPPRDSAGLDLATLPQDVVANPEKYANNVNENLCRDGRKVWMAWTNKPILDETGQVAEILAVGIDVTERMRAEEALRESEQRYRSLFDNMLDGYAYCRMIYQNGLPCDFVYLGVNDAFERFTGLKDVVGKKVSQVIPGIAGSSPKLLQTYGRVAMTGQPERFEIYLDSLKIWFLISVYSPAKDHFVTVFDNITHRKQAEEELRQAAENLRRSNKELEQFAYVASHDLQEPLRTVGGLMELLRNGYKGKLDAKADQYIDYAVDGANRMSRMIKDLLEYSRTGSKGFKPAPVNFAAVVRVVQASLKAAIKESKAVITLDPLPTAAADAPQITQVFQNLIANAIKFRSPDRPCRVHVGARQLEGQWLFSVRDNGIGIDPKNADRLFKIFQRLHARDKYPGSGIGLAICKKIVERHGGRIWVESTPDEGSTFCFTLPASTPAVGNAT